jgi:hypothetical protein
MLRRMTPWIGAEDASAWAFGWEALVAIGTLALAGATAWLAFKTAGLADTTAQEVEHSRQQVETMKEQVAGTQRQVDASLEQVRATQEQARTAQDTLAAAREQTGISRLTLEAQIRPVLIDVRPDPDRPETTAYPGRDVPVNHYKGAALVWAPEGEVLISVPFRNAGAGLAMIRGVDLAFRTKIGTPSVMLQPANVARGEYGRVSFRSIPGDAGYQPLRDAIATEQDFSVVVGYTDLAGQQHTLSRFDIYFHPRESWEWEVRQVHLQNQTADAPFASSGPTA